jgi:AmmeMemoRadiSam system protein B
MVRYPAVAGQFYAGKEASLRREVEACFNSPIGPGHLPKLESGPRNIVGVVVPHAGLVYSGPVAAHVYAALAKDGFPETFVILGPNHNGIGAGVATTDEDFETPFGIVSIDREITSKLKGVVDNDPVSHRFEHSIEVQLPFLQYIKRDIKIVPISMGFQDFETAVDTAKAVKKAIAGKDVCIIASSDFSHYIPPEKARQLDAMVIEKILALDPKGMYSTVTSNDISMCGYGPVMTMLLICEGKQAKLLKYANSGDVHPMDTVVGYAGIIVTK